MSEKPLNLTPLFRFYPTSAKNSVLYMVQKRIGLYSKLKEIKILFYRVGNTHADLKEPFVLAFNVLVRKSLSLERGALTAKGEKSGEKSPTIKPLFLRLFLRI